MQLLLTVLYLVSAALPIVGIARLYRKVKPTVESIRQEGEFEGITLGTFGKLAQVQYESTLERPAELRIDLWLVGGGVAIGALASILAVWCL